MPQTLLTGATGLLAHQRQLDVVANNIANINTTGYKTQRVLFSDMIYTMHRPAQGPSNNLGGLNPLQVGNGVNVSQISKDFSQGILTNTGQAFDFAIEGNGFFVVSGAQQSYTRDGAFATDANGFLVDPSTGGRVQRFSTIGEGTGTEPAYQTTGDSGIFIPMGASVPGKATTESGFIGNLPATATPPLAEVLTTAAPLTTAGVAIDATNSLNGLDANATDYIAGDTIQIVGTNVDGSSFSVSIPAGPAVTVSDLVNAINAQLVGATVSVSAEGNLVVQADNTGEAFLSLSIEDGATNVGATDFSDNIFIVQTEGKAGDTVESTIQVFDSRGQPHAIQVSFVKQDFNRWDAEFSSGDATVNLTDNSVASIQFDEDGSFQAINGFAGGDSNIELTIDGLTNPQTIEVSLENFTHLATNYAATFEQDGFPPGNIVSMIVSPEGILTGVATNGRRLAVAQLAVARFANNSGLESAGQNYYVQSGNSGSPSIGPAQSGGSGAVRGGQLEASNVDIALEFTQLIVAQRGFSANARSITVATEVLQELNNIFR